MSSIIYRLYVVNVTDPRLPTNKKGEGGVIVQPEAPRDRPLTHIYTTAKLKT